MGVYLGTKERDGSTVSIHGKDRRKHMAIFGKSGVGKTTLMRNMVVADFAAGNGVTVVDPHGSLSYERCHIPQPRRDPSRVIGLTIRKFSFASLNHGVLEHVLLVRDDYGHPPLAAPPRH